MVTISSLVCLSVMVILGVNKAFLGVIVVNTAVPDVPTMHMYNKF